MKVKQEMLLEAIDKPMVKHSKINLSKITKIVNSLNEVIAPTINSDINNGNRKLQNKIANYKDNVKGLKTLSNEVAELKVKRESLLKQLSVISLLSDLHANYVSNEKIKAETLVILNELDTYSIKKLDLQIGTLKKVLSRS